MLVSSRVLFTPAVFPAFVCFELVGEGTGGWGEDVDADISMRTGELGVDEHLTILSTPSLLTQYLSSRRPVPGSHRHTVPSPPPESSKGMLVPS
mmetsp:Transcript_6735/g.13368  ORF Transcript_6735/g.13368 Transcript_6735/m.13368 type:complete len:94 (-) Transcript_6735:663-944(-)